ncbi:MAG: ACT domain-containing protein [Bacteroidota bacterium]
MAVRDLQQLLQEAHPVRQPGSYVFVTTGKAPLIPVQDIVMSFREAEGITLILERAVADRHQLAYDLCCYWITMQVHSALDAVGFTAAFSTALAEVGISCNVVAGYHHDHIFIPEKDGERGLEVLLQL